MRTVNKLLAALALAMPIAAQTVAQEAKTEVKGEKLWKIETSGIGGWAAPSQAQRVSSILEKQKTIKGLIFDTCGVGYFQVGKDVPEIADLNAALVKGRVKDVKITSLKEVELAKTEAVFELQVSGLGWGNTAIETRDVLSKLEGVIRVHPNGLNGKALVFVSTKDTFNEAKAKEALLNTKELRLRKFEKAKV